MFGDLGCDTLPARSRASRSPSCRMDRRADPLATDTLLSGRGQFHYRSRFKGTRNLCID